MRIKVHQHIGIHLIPRSLDRFKLIKHAGRESVVACEFYHQRSFLFLMVGVCHGGVFLYLHHMSVCDRESCGQTKIRTRSTGSTGSLLGSSFSVSQQASSTARCPAGRSNRMTIFWTSHT